MFCGNPLAGGKPVSAEGGTAGAGGRTDRKKEEGERWDPETVYVQSRGRKIALLIAAVLLVAIVSLIYAIQPRIHGVSSQAFTPPVGTPGASGLAEMTQMLKEAGLRTVGNPYQLSNKTYQQFFSSTIMGEKTTFSVAEVEEGYRIAVSHAFDEEKGKYYTLRYPGPVFERLLEKLAQEFGKPVIQGAEDYYYWTQNGDMLTLYYGYDNVIWLSFFEEFKSASV